MNNIQPENLGNIVKVKEEENENPQSEVMLLKFPRLPEDQFLVVSGCFDELFKSNCEEFNADLKK